MRRISLSFLFLFASLSLSWAQQQSLSAAGQSAGPLLLVGTRVRVKLDSTLSTNVARPGDGVEAIVIKRVDRSGVVVLPAGTHIRGKVKAVRSANRNDKIDPNLMLVFDQVILPDGRLFRTSASIADVGRRKHVDSTGLVTQPDLSNRKKLAIVAIYSATGAAAGAHYEGKGAGIGAAAGAGVGGLIVLLDSRRYSDFELHKGRKLWLRLNSDLMASIAGGPCLGCSI